MADQRKLADGGIVIPCTSDTFIRAWLEIMHPLHRLSNREMDIAAEIIKRRYRLAEGVSDSQLINVDKVLFSKDEKASIAKALGITPQFFRTTLQRLRACGIVQGNTVNPKYLPDWTPGKPFRWLFIFKNSEE